MLSELRIFCRGLLQDLTDFSENTGENEHAVKEASADCWMVFVTFIGALDYSDTELVSRPSRFVLRYSTS